MLGVDWAEVLLPETPVVETLARGVVTYVAIFVMLRVILKRETGGVTVTDILFVVLLADAAQNAMAGDYESISDGLLLVATILGTAVTIDWLAYRFQRIERFVDPPPLPLVVDGRMLRKNMRRELITPDELRSMLREHHIEDVSQVRKAYLEGNGRLSVLHWDDSDRRRPGAG